MSSEEQVNRIQPGGRAGVSPLPCAAATLQPAAVSRSRVFLPRLRRLGAAFLLQAALWIGLTFAFAALIEVSGMAAWSVALSFSANNWLPWIVFAPATFWLARRFPFEKGQLLRAIPIHTIACAATCVAMLWIGAYFAPVPRSFRPSDNRGSGMTEIAGPFRDWRDRDRDMSVRRTDRPTRPPGEPALEAPPPPTRGDAADGATATSSRGERGTSERRTKTSGSFRGPSGPPGPPSQTMRTLFALLWPPFSGVVLRANVSAAIYVIIACFAHAFAYYRRAREGEKQALALAAGLSRAKLDALRLQLQPHFLFNTLNAISTLVHRDPNAADELIGNLSELLRLSLQTADHEVPLSRELELLDCYLSIEQTRLGDRLRIVREVDPQALSALVPTFLLQPLAENAVRHGIEPRLAPGSVTLRVDVVGDNLRIVLADDGVGLKTGTGTVSRRGIGITNTEERLRALHGPSAHLDFTTPESGGVRVQIVLPRRTTPAADPAPLPA